MQVLRSRHQRELEIDKIAADIFLCHTCGHMTVKVVSTLLTAIACERCLDGSVAVRAIGR